MLSAMPDHDTTGDQMAALYRRRRALALACIIVPVALFAAYLVAVARGAL